MNERDNDKLSALLKKVIPPLADTELKRDLWPQMLQRIDEGALRVPWFDWVLLALVMVFFARFPRLILVLLYHL